MCECGFGSGSVRFVALCCYALDFRCKLVRLFLADTAPWALTFHLYGVSCLYQHMIQQVALPSATLAPPCGHPPPHPRQACSCAREAKLDQKKNDCENFGKQRPLLGNCQGASCSRRKKPWLRRRSGPGQAESGEVGLWPGPGHRGTWRED